MDLDLFNTHDKVTLAEIASVTGDGNGTGVNVAQYIGTGIVHLAAINTAGTTPTLDVKLQGSPDNSTWSDISGVAFTQATNAAASNQTLSLNLDSCPKYVRVVDDIGGTSSPAFTRVVTLIARKQVI